MPIKIRKTLLHEPITFDTIGNHWDQVPIYRQNGYPLYHYLQTEKGVGKIEIQGKSYLLNENEGILIAPFIPHSYAKKTDEWFTMFITFTGTMESSLSQALGNKQIIFIPKEQGIIIAKELADSTGQQELELKSSGGLYFSLLIGQYLDIDQVALVPSIGVAVCVAIERLTENLIPSLRWIDDIYINQEKVGGIRIDSLINLETKENKVAVIGVNIDYEKINKLTKTTVEYNDKEIEKNALIAEIINQIMYSITEILQKQVMSEYKEKIQIIGKKIRIDNTNKETIGIVTDVLDDGSLLLESDGKQRQTVRYSENLIINVLD